MAQAQQVAKKIPADLGATSMVTLETAGADQPPGELAAGRRRDGNARIREQRGPGGLAAAWEAASVIWYAAAPCRATTRTAMAAGPEPKDARTAGAQAAARLVPYQP